MYACLLLLLVPFYELLNLIFKCVFVCAESKGALRRNKEHSLEQGDLSCIESSLLLLSFSYYQYFFINPPTLDSSPVH